MGFPKFPVYEKLIGQLEYILRDLGIICYLVDENGEIAVNKIIKVWSGILPKAREQNNKILA